MSLGANEQRAYFRDIEERLDKLLTRESEFEREKLRRLLELTYFGQAVPGHASTSPFQTDPEDHEKLKLRLREMRKIVEELLLT